MTKTDDQTTLHTLVDFLENERKALLSADFQFIEENYDQKKMLMETVQLERSHRKDDLEIVRRKIKRNQELFEHALSGIQAVSLRIKEARRAAEGMDTYDAQGNPRKELKTREPTI